MAKNRKKSNTNEDIKNVLENTSDPTKQQLITNLRRAKFNYEFKNGSQQKIWDLIENNQIVFACGPAGTGKSYISALKAIDLLRQKKSYRKIVIIKPAIEADEKNGFLPGTLFEKMYPFVYSTLYILEKILGKNKVDFMLSNDIIEIMSLAYMRGINLDSCIVIMEEAQNMTIRQIRTLLTRIGENCKMIISGDISQSDRFVNEKESGLYYAMERLKSIDDIGILTFSDYEIVRNPIIGKILDALK